VAILTKQEKYDLILVPVKKHEKLTANECIDIIFKEDLTAGLVNSVDRGWKFYLHLNKLFSSMEKEGVITQKGTKIGPSRREEKVWSLL